MGDAIAGAQGLPIGAVSERREGARGKLGSRAFEGAVHAHEGGPLLRRLAPDRLLQILPRVDGGLGQIDGRVVDKGGRPIPGARIGALGKGWQHAGQDPGLEREMLFRTALSSDDGRFVLEGFDQYLVSERRFLELCSETQSTLLEVAGCTAAPPTLDLEFVDALVPDNRRSFARAHFHVRVEHGEGEILVSVQTPEGAVVEAIPYTRD